MGKTLYSRKSEGKQQNKNKLIFLLASFMLLKGKGQSQYYAAMKHQSYFEEFRLILLHGSAYSKSFDLANKIRGL